MLSATDIRVYYERAALNIPPLWNLSRKHFRVETSVRRFVKLNRFQNRLNEGELSSYLAAYAPLHAYFSVLDWLFPERVGKKYKANRARGAEEVLILKKLSEKAKNMTSEQYRKFLTNLECESYARARESIKTKST